jgi:hypothetical protein
VIVEAALGRWEEFDRERAMLRDARERGAAGLGAEDSDVIDSFDVAGTHWIVREYTDPVGREHTRYNFEAFSAEGRVKEYISLESASAADAMLATPGGPAAAGTAAAQPVRDYALDWYTGSAHGRIRAYPGDEPSYERVRADAMAFLRRQARAAAH